MKYEEKPKRAWIELSEPALLNNVRSLREKIPKNCQLMPAVKANAYGHGDILIAGMLQECGITYFCTATLAEAIRLRKAGINGEILVLGYTDVQDFPLLQKYGIQQTIIDFSFAKSLNQAGFRIRGHLAIDTGMHRLGVEHTDLKEITEIFAMENIEICGIYSHLCVADSREQQDINYTINQAEALGQVVKHLQQAGRRCPVHLLGSYGMLRYPQYAGDFVRIGLALYGAFSCLADRKLGETLEPVLSLKAKIGAIREIAAGERLGYGLDFVAKRKSRIAIVTIGYADGLPRALSNGKGRVLIGGEYAPIVGRICMDQLTVDISHLPEQKVGAEVVFIGEQGTKRIFVEEIAEQCGTISNEILSRLGDRPERLVVGQKSNG